MNEHDKQTTIGYWLALTFAAVLVRIGVAFFVFGAVPEESDPAAYASQARQMVAEAGNVHVYFWPPGRSFAAGAVLRGVRDVKGRRSSKLDFL